VIAEGEPKEVLSDEKLIKAFGASLWNISLLPNLKSSEGNKNAHH
jgi:ABC-type hemin transport system ATPase subunit